MLNERSITIEDFDQLSGEWDTLVRESNDCSVFATPLWQRAWWAAFGAGANLRLITLRQSKRLEAVVPLMQRGGELSFLGSTDLVDYHEIPCRGDWTENFQALVDFLKEDPTWRVMRLGSLPEWGHALRGLKAALDAAGLSYEIQLEDVSPGIILPDSWEDFLTTLSGKQRHELRRKLRRAHRAGQVELHVICEATEIEQRLDAFFELMRKSHAEKDRFLTTERQTFMRQVIAQLAMNRRARLYLLTLDDCCVAGSVVFVLGDRHYAYNSGFDPAFGHLSVGVVNHALAIRKAISERASFFDFLRGGETYKYQLGAKDRRIYQFSVKRR